ncbi:unnamed protein product [Camellia sinensis]
MGVFGVFGSSEEVFLWGDGVVHKMTSFRALLTQKKMKNKNRANGLTLTGSREREVEGGKISAATIATLTESCDFRSSSLLSPIATNE